MIRLRRSNDRGFADHGWLATHHTFSFGQYHDPAQMGFRSLRVLNQDRVAPGEGFEPHAHRDMEIVSLVLEGQLEHRDSMGHGSKMLPGEVQLMSAGSGVTHSEFNASRDEELEFLQMWILPRQRRGEPRYEQKHFDMSPSAGHLRLVVSPDGREGSLTIGQDALMYVGKLLPGERVSHTLAPARGAYLHLAHGGGSLNGQDLVAGDGAVIEDTREIVFEASKATVVVLWDML